MPKELETLDDVTEDILNRTLAVYSKRSGEAIKYKLRTKKTLYTIKVEVADSNKFESKITAAGRSLEIIPQ